MLVFLYRQLFCCCRRIHTTLFSPEEIEESVVPVSKLPWMWIGAKYEDGNTVDYTTQINETLEYHMVVSTEWLQLVTGQKNVTWRYLDAKTLEERDFPSKGFVIDDSVNPDPEESDDE